MPLVYFLGGMVGGWFLRGALASSREKAILAQLRNETEKILDGVGRMHQTGALGAMRDFKLSHGDAKNNVKLLITPQVVEDDPFAYAANTQYP